jgi:hypothetical protein
MTTAAEYHRSFVKPSWFARTEHWLDSKGRGAWVAASLGTLIIAWPIGLAVTFYAIWSNKMFMKSRCRTKSRNHDMHHSSGNSAFDAYRQETLDRLAQEQDDFQSFLHRLREAKDRAEFDQFIKDRKSTTHDA